VPARIARLISMQLEGPADTAISKEDRDLMQSVRGSLSDDDESSEDEAQILKNTMYREFHLGSCARALTFENVCRSIMKPYR